MLYIKFESRTGGPHLLATTVSNPPVQQRMTDPPKRGAISHPRITAPDEGNSAQEKPRREPVTSLSGLRPSSEG
jgi:hypothetical protein